MPQAPRVLTTSNFPQHSYYNIASNFLNIPSTAQPQSKAILSSETAYPRSLEHFVRNMDETARESVAGFIKSLRNSPDSLNVSEELLKQIQTPMETEITRQNLKDLISLAQLGVDVEFIGEIEPSLKPYIPLKYNQYVTYFL